MALAKSTCRLNKWYKQMGDAPGLLVDVIHDCIAHDSCGVDIRSIDVKHDIPVWQ